MDNSSSTWADDRLHGADTATPVTPRPAATVILARDGANGCLELFMVRRRPTARFAPDAYVFPGGTLRPDDWVAGAAPPVPRLSSSEAQRRLSERGGSPPESAEECLAVYMAALRELFEEAGVLLARPTGQPTAPLDSATWTRLSSTRPEVQAGRSLVQIVLDAGLTLAPEDLVYFSHWITPAVSPRRYDTRFFVAAHRVEQMASHCGVETVEGGWYLPADMLRRGREGTATLVSVTAEHLRVIAGCETLAQLLELARTKSIRTVLPIRDHGGWDIGGPDLPW